MGSLAAYHKELTTVNRLGYSPAHHFVLPLTRDFVCSQVVYYELQGPSILIPLRKYPIETLAFTSLLDLPLSDYKFVMIPEISCIRRVTDNLQLLYHRNKNQHRRGKWWRWLGMLRRCFVKLLREIVRGEIASVEARTRYLEEYLLPSCYMYASVIFDRSYAWADSIHSSFTQLVRDNQFSTLGLVLLSQISEIRGIILPVNNGATTPRPMHSTASITSSMDALTSNEDFGEAVERSVPTEILAPANRLPVNMDRITSQRSFVEVPTNPRSPSIGQLRRTREDSFQDNFADVGFAQKSRNTLPQKKSKRKRKRPTTAVIDDLFKELT